MNAEDADRSIPSHKVVIETTKNKRIINNYTKIDIIGENILCFF